jgi:glycosyltransferase involved in cell wall biosynthesis
VSVVVPVLNEARDIRRLLGELMEQISPPGGYETIVVDGGSVDETRKIIDECRARWPGLSVLENPGKLSSSGRNVGARASRGRYILFLDGHCAVPRKDYLVRTVELFESSGADCLCRPQNLERLAEEPWEQAISTARHSWLGHNAPSDIYGGAPAFTNPRSAGAAYRRVCFERLGGFDERFDACEDVEFNHRVAKAGLRAYRHPDLLVDYRPRRDLGSLFRQMARYGRGRARLLARHSGPHPWPLLLVSALVLAGALLLLARGWSAAIVPASFLLGSWILLIGAESVRLGGVGVRAVRTAAAFLVIHAGLTLGFWRGILEFGRFRSSRESSS